MTDKIAPTLRMVVAASRYVEADQAEKELRALLAVARAAGPAGDMVCGCRKCHPLINRLRAANARLRTRELTQRNDQTSGSFGRTGSRRPTR